MLKFSPHNGVKVGLKRENTWQYWCEYSKQTCIKLQQVKYYFETKLKENKEILKENNELLTRFIFLMKG